MRLATAMLQRHRKWRGMSSAYIRPPRDMFEEVKPVLWALMWGGSLCIARSSDGRVYAPRRSLLWMLLTLKAILVAGVAYHSIRRCLIGLKQPGMSYEMRIAYLLHILMLHPGLYLPNLQWSLSPKVARYMNAWTDFQVILAWLLGVHIVTTLIISIDDQANWQMLLGTPLSFSIRRKSNVLVFIGMWFLAVGCLFQVILRPELELIDALVFDVVGTHGAFLPCIFTLTNSEVISAAEKMTRAFKAKSSANGGGAPSVQELRAFQQLWRELRAICGLGGDVWGFAVMQHLVVSVGTQFTAGFSWLGARSTSMVQVSFFSTMEQFFFCTSAEYAVCHVKRSLLQELIRIKLPRDSETVRAVHELVNVINDEPPAISLCGFTIINRRLLVSVASMVVTYLIVLAQLSL